MVRAVCRKRPGITLHQDTAPCHKAQFTMDMFQRLNTNLVHHPACSSDLAPCDFALIPRLEAQELRRAVTDFVASIPAQEFKNIFVKWCERWRKCIQCKGEYFEKE